MRTSDSKPIISEQIPDYIQKGYFIDYFLHNDSYADYQIQQIIDRQIYLRNWRTNTKLPSVNISEVKTKKLRPFREISKPAQKSICYHKTYCYWGLGIIDVLHFLQTINKCATLKEIGEKFTNVELVQNIRGRLFYTAQSVRCKEHFKSRKDQLSLFIIEFLTFFQKYYVDFPIQYLDIDNKSMEEFKTMIYLRQSYQQMIFSLGYIFNRDSLPPAVEAEEQNQRQGVDKLILQQSQWLKQKIIVSFDRQKMRMLKKFQLLRFIQIITKQVKENRLEATEQLCALITQFFQATLEDLTINSKKEYDDYLQATNLIIDNLEASPEYIKKSIEFKFSLILKFHESFEKKLHMQYSDKVFYINKQIAFISFCLDRYSGNPLYQQLASKFSHLITQQYLQSVYINPLSMAKQVKKLFKFDTAIFISVISKVKRFMDVLKATHGQWTIELLIQALKQMMSGEKSEKQEFLNSITLYKFVINQIYEKIHGVTNSFMMSYSIPESHRSSGELIKSIREKQENGPLFSQVLLEYEDYLIRISEKIFEEKTSLFEYIKQIIIPRYILRWRDKIGGSLLQKQTNLFRQQFLLQQYLNKSCNQLISPQCPIPQQEKNLRISTIFQQLVTSMTDLKSKSQLEARKENLKFLLQKSHRILDSPERFVDLIIFYMKKLPSVMNRDFRNKGYDEIVLNQFGLGQGIFKTVKEKIRGQKRIMEEIKIQNISSYKLFIDFFKYVNTKQLKMKLVEDSPTFICEKPFGLIKLLEVFERITDKNSLMKVQAFFQKFPVKMVQFEQKRQTIKQVIVKILSLINNFKNDRQGLQSLKQLVRLLESIIFCEYSLQLNNIYQSTFENFLRKDMTSSSVNNGARNYSSSLSSSSGKKMSDINEDTNTKISIQVKLFRDLNSFQACSEEKIFEVVTFDVEDETKLYQVKLRCCKLSGLNAFATTIYSGSKRYFHQDELLTIQKIYSNLRASGDKPTECLQMHIAQNENEKKRLNLCLVEDKSLDFLMKIIKENRRSIFNSLPYTIRIWDSLQITNEDWRTEEDLISIKQSFIKYFTQSSNPDIGMKDEGLKSCLSEQQLEEMNQPCKKMIVLKVLIENQDILNINSAWIFNTFTAIKDKHSLQSNIYSIMLLQKFKPIINKEKFKILMSIQMQNNQNQLYLKQSKAQYQNFLKLLFMYILQNSDFQLFKQLMLPIWQTSLLEGSQVFKRELNDLKVRAFTIYIETMYDDFEIELLQFSNFLKNKSFDNFIRIASQRQYDKYLRRSDALLMSFGKWLNFMLDISLQHPQQMMMETNSAIAGLILRIICFLLNKDTTSEKLYSAQWRKFMTAMIQGKFIRQSLEIITEVSKEDKIFAVHFIRLFLQKLYDEDLSLKQQIKYSPLNKRQESGFVGLRNPHSICYANSLLQQLYHIKPFRSSLLECEWKREKDQKQDLVYQIKKIFLNLQYKQTECYYNSNFFHAFKNYEGEPTNVELQMDADEFRIILLDRIESLLVKQEGEKHFLQKFLMGKQLTRVKCMQCSNQSIKEEDFHSINIPIKGMKDLLNSLKENYYKPQILKDQNMYDCQKCKKKVVAEKTHQIKQYPPYLTFVLKRFDYVSYIKKKVNERFQFPIETFTFGDNNLHQYRLKGIVVHQGLSQSGHYFSYIKQNETWYEFNDNTVTETDVSQVVNDSFGESLGKSTRNAYLLFYERVENKIVEQQLQRISRDRIKMTGIQKQFYQIQKLKQYYRKIQLFLCEEFNNFVQTVVMKQYSQSCDLLLIYFINVKSKYKKYYPANFQQAFQYLSRYCFQPILSSELLVSLVLSFYENGSCQNVTIYDPHAKKQMTKLLVSTYQQFNPYYEKFISKCIQMIHLHIQTGPIYELLYLFAKKDAKVLSFIIGRRIVGRIYDVTIPLILFTKDRKSISQMCNPPFEIISDQQKLSKKKKAESNQYRYMKWKLLNLIIQSNLQISEIQSTFLYNWADRKCQQIFEEATSKPNINQISKFFCNLAKKNLLFGRRYVQQICEQLSKEKSQTLRKYLKSAADLLDIEDGQQEDRVKKICECFRQSFKNLHKMRTLGVFDIKWQWFLKIAIRNRCFRKYIKSNIVDFRLLLNKPELLQIYARPDNNPDAKFKNRLYGLKFQNLNGNYSILDIKIQRTRNIMNGDQSINFMKEQQEDRYWDTDLTTFSEQISLQSINQVMQYNQSKQQFEKVNITDVLGDSFKIGDHVYFVQNQKFIHLLENTRRKNKQATDLRQNEMQMQMCNQYKAEGA